MRRSMAVATGTLALAAGVGRAHATAYTFQTIDAPGSRDASGSRTLTELYGINDRGQIVGFYYGFNGFEYDAGKITLVQPSSFTSGDNYNAAYGINNNGQIVGQNSAYSFVDINGSFVYELVPIIDCSSCSSGSSLLFQPNSVNDLGQIAGTNFRIGHSTGPGGGQLLNPDGTTTAVNLPGAIVLTLTGINNAGQLTGSYSPTTNSVPPFSAGFLDSNGVVTTLLVPGATGITSPQGISNTGEVVGNFYTLWGTNGSHGFAYDNGTYTTIDVPGATATYAQGVNIEGDIVGYYTDPAGDHGFIATPVPVPEPASLTLLAAALAALGLVASRRPAT